MDKRVFRLAILTIISAFILVMVIVYATNARRINELLGKGEKKSSSQVAQDATSEASEEVSDEQVIYGDQIGDNLSGFLTDEDFFDEPEQIPTVVVIERTSQGSVYSGGAGENAVLPDNSANSLSSDATAGDNIKSDSASAPLVGDDGITGNSSNAADNTAEAAAEDSTVSTDGTSGETHGTGMAVVGQLINPNPEAMGSAGTTPDGTAQAGLQDQPATTGVQDNRSAATDSSGYLTTVPQTPPGGFGEYIPPGETIGGTPVGDVP